MNVCPRCGGLMLRDVYGDPTCMLCGYVYVSPEQMAAAEDDAERYIKQHPGRYVGHLRTVGGTGAKLAESIRESNRLYKARKRTEAARAALGERRKHRRKVVQ